MTNWEVTMVNTNTPFEMKRVYVTTETIIEAQDMAEENNPGYYARSSRFHATDLNKEFGYGYGPTEAL